MSNPIVPRPRPPWLSSGILRSVLFLEPPVLRKYLGYAATPGGAALLGPRTLESFAQNNVSLVWLRFFAGFGLAFEKAEMDAVREAAAGAHALGLKAAFTVSLGALVPETLLLEESECQNWLQANSDGRPVPAGAHSFRVRPCYNSEAFLRFMERACGLAVEAGADLVHFTDAAYSVEPDTCRCPLCVAAFREFVRQQYGGHDERTRLAGLERFGHNTFTHLRPPAFSAQNPYSSSTSAKETPHEQEWAKFKLHTLSACLARLSNAISRRNPECAVGADILHPARQAAVHGIGYAEQLPHLDLISARLPESGPPAGGCAPGAPGPDGLAAAREFQAAVQTWESDLFSENRIAAGEQTFAVYETKT